MRRFGATKNPLRESHQTGAKHHANNGREEDEQQCFGPARWNNHSKARLRHGASGVPANKGMRGTGRQSKQPRDNVPSDGANQAGENDLRIDRLDVDHACTYRLRDPYSESKCGYKVEKSSPNNSLTRRQHSRRYDGCYGIRSVMKAI